MQQPLDEHQQAINELRAILLREDRQQLDELRHALEDEEFSKRVNALIGSQIDFFKQEFPAEFYTVINQWIDHRIQHSQQEILDVIYPVMGKMIKKYIQHQFELLRESIEEQIQRTQVIIFPWTRKKASEEKANQLLADLNTSQVQEIYVIQKNSGILLGSHSVQETIDADALAGMFTAIKLFVEDAFSQKSQNLEAIRYENYQIFVYNAYSYYIAVALAGSLSSRQTSELEDVLIQINEQLNQQLVRVDDSTNYQVKTILQQHFTPHKTLGK
ncbi:MAG: hypothetical protein AAGI23_06435 [Bacteroidota bacterium]